MTHITFTTSEQRDGIRRMRKDTNLSLKQIGARFGVTGATVHGVCHDEMRGLRRSGPKPGVVYDNVGAPLSYDDVSMTQRWSDRRRTRCPVPNAMPGIPLSRLMGGR